MPELAPATTVKLPDQPTTREARALAKIAQAKAELRKIEQEKNKDRRKLETRAKIILGGLALGRPEITADLLSRASDRDKEFLRLNFDLR